MSAPVSSREQKIAWLVEHHAEWAGYPGTYRNETARKTFRAMRVAGLYGPRAEEALALSPLGGYVNEARRRMRIARRLVPVGGERGE